MPQTLSYTQGGSTLLSTAYTYDSRGNIATMTVDGVTWSYTYDSLNQLTGVTTSDNSFTASYSYDNGGNITSKTVNGVTTTYGYNDPNWKDKLTRYGNEGVSSDRIGNIWQIGTYQMSYVGRQLIEVYTAENNTINFYYNADGIRVKKVNEDIGTTNYFVDGSTILAEQTGTDVIWYIYDSNGEIVGFTYNEVPYYYLKNQQGDVYKIVEENGTLAGSYTYDPWGKVLTCTGTIAEINPIRYRSYYYDTETGYYYLQSRYYDPELGRFISADMTISEVGDNVLGNNLYAYCFNNPVNMDDQDGNWPKWLKKAAKWVKNKVIDPIVDFCEDVVESAVTKVYNFYNALGVTTIRSEGGVQINNSYRILSFTGKYMYCYYLNHYSEHKDEIDGSTMGMVFEWDVHNVAYYGAKLVTALGVPAEKTATWTAQAKHVNLGSTIYDDNHPKLSKIMWIGYTLFLPLYALSDAVVYAESKLPFYMKN